MAETWNEAAERAVLGAVLADNGQLPAVRGTLQPADFHAPAHQEIFAAMLQLASIGQPVDCLTLAEALKARGQLAAAGGPTALMQLDQAAPLSANAATYATAVRESAMKRKLASIGRRLTALAEDPAVPAAKLLATATKHLLASEIAVARWKMAGECMQGAFDRMVAVGDGRTQPIIKTGLRVLDDVIGGWQPSLSVIGARTGVGKSAFLATAIQNAARAGYRVAVFSLEDEADWLVWRYLSQASGVNQFVLRFKKQTDAQAARVGAASAGMHEWIDRIMVDDRPGLTAEQVALAMDDAVANRGAQIVFIDHLKEMDHQAMRRERHDLCIEASLQVLRAAQKRHGIPLVLAHQLVEDRSGRNVDGPSLADFSDARVVGKMARVALALTRDTGGDTMRIHVLKQTNGVAGRCVDVSFVHAAAMVADAEDAQEALPLASRPRRLAVANAPAEPPEDT